MGAEDGARNSADEGALDGPGDGAERPELGSHRHTYRPEPGRPAAFALFLLALTPFSALVYLLTLLLCALFGWEVSLATGVPAGLALLGPFTVRVVWLRRHTRVEFRLYEKGLVAIAADGTEAVFLWRTTAVFTSGSHHYKLSNPEGTVVTLGAAHRGLVLGGERIRGLRTRTVIRGARLPQQEEWGPAIRQGVRDARLVPATETALAGGEVPFADLVLSRDGLTIRRRRGQDDFTAWEDVDSLSLTAEGDLYITSRGSDFPTHFIRPGYQVANLEIFLDVADRLRADRPRATRAPTDPTPTPTSASTSASASASAAAPAGTPPGSAADTRDDDDAEPLIPVPELLSLYVVFGVAAYAAWRLGTRDEIDGMGSALLATARAALGGLVGAALGVGLAAAVMAVPKVVGEVILEALIRWFRHRRYVAAAVLALCTVVPSAALLLVLFRAFPSRLVPLVVLLFFGGWTLLLAVRRCGTSDRLVVRHLPDLPGVFLVVLAAEQLVSGDVLTLTPAAGLFFPLAFWLALRGWRKLSESVRPTVRAAADIVLSVQLGLVLTVLMVWLANVLSFTPPQVTAVRSVVEKVQGLTEVHWLYWLAAYTLLAVGSYAVLRWPDRVARVRQRLRPARFSESRLPAGATANFVRRSLSGVNVGLMVALLFVVVAAPVSEGAWKRPVAERYALEVQRREYAEGAAAAYKEIHQQVSVNPRAAARLRAVILAVDRAAPSTPGEPVNGTALGIARHVGRFQAATLAVDEPAPQPAPAPEAEDLGGRLDELDENQRRTAEREEQTDRFAELASLAITRTFDAVDLGDSQVVQLVKEYLGGLVEDGPMKRIFHRWGEGIGTPPPDGGRLLRIDVRRLTSVAYERTQAAVRRADADLLTFYGRFGVGVPADDTSLAPVIDLANQRRYLQQGTGPCAGCAGSPNGGSGTGGGGGGGRR
ncbi:MULTISPECIES: hypothetical protein [Streptomyces]|uniref:hypothetical protein n=1 Tax=Streptomyces TaxID=1883 RepID=UPI001E4FCD5D|nr:MULTISPECIES: hypothetical protein [Streptomyces]UFQ19446.1 hypothetical protein J2N69_33265 [Streptomyces huasconensis]WCL89065.1 hypothetical protein PPN52_33215 [Streptomyces sp. JCM 35825]